jgi:hypothetical protein
MIYSYISDGRCEKKLASQEHFCQKLSASCPGTFHGVPQTRVDGMVHSCEGKKHVKGCHEKKTKKGKRGANSSCHRTGANSLNLMPKRDKIGWNRALYSPNTPGQQTPSSPNDPATYTSSFSLKMKFRNHDRFRTRCFLALLLMHLLHSATNITGCRYECNLIKASRR